MTTKRAEMLLNAMMVVDMYTLGRACKDVTQEELDWRPHPGAWGLVERDGRWECEVDQAVVEQAFHDGGKTIEPMTTIGWLLNHFGAAPGLVAQLTIVGGPLEPTMELYQQMWGHTVIPTAEEAVTRFQEGWRALEAALRSTTDEMLERKYPGHPWIQGDLAVTAMINEVSHHGTQICVLRDLFHHRRV